MQNLIDQINTGSICSPHWLEDEIEMDGATMVATIDRDEHRWYTIATVVFKVGEEYFGVRGPVSIKDENSSFSDVGHKCEAFLMEQIPSVTYRRK